MGGGPKSMEASGLACWFKDGRRLSILNAGEGAPALSFLIQQCTYREAEESGRCRWRYKANCFLPCASYWGGGGRET